MPYVGERNGQLVSPLDVREDETVSCPECGGALGVRTGHFNRGKLIARHFFHQNGSDCPGESDIHRRMKTIACLKLQQVFPFANIDDEVQIGDRIADTIAIFPESIKPFGDGLVVEVQHKNKGKNIGRVSQEYLDHGFSVFWAYQSDFEKHEMEFAPHRARTVWPDALPDRTGLDGYPDVIEDLWTGEFTSPSHREVPIPGEFWRTHALELVSPAEGHVEHDWDTLDDIWLHSEGGRIAWWNIHRSPDGETYLELWTKDRNSGETKHVLARVDVGDLQRFGDCLSEFRRRRDEVDRSSTICSVSFAGVANAHGEIAFVRDHSGQIRFQMARQDHRGNARTIALDYRDGDINRLETLGQRLARALET
jgi:hypothetical protein